MYSLYGVENPLMDVIAHVDYAFLERFGKNPGTMHLVEYSEITALVSQLPSYSPAPGGSAANTARGIAWLSGAAGQALRDEVLGGQLTTRLAPGQPVFNGAIGRDGRGDEFVSLMEQAGVHAALVRKDTPTGTSVILVTPDGERTMNTFLGACRDFTIGDLDLERLADSRMLYLTGYLWDTENQRHAADSAAEFARGRDITIAFDLADPFAVRRFGEKLVSWIPRRVDVLFGNRDELALLTGSSCDEECVEKAMTLCPVVVMKMGGKGCMVGWDGRCEHVPGVKVKVVDTTGAGDAFAAGYLHGRLLGASPLDCARLANAVAARIVGVQGCTY